MSGNQEIETNNKKQTSLRVGIDLLDSLMALAGELVLSRNQLLQGINTGDPLSIQVSSQRIDMITSQLQETVMKTRMQPLDNTLNRYSQIVKEISSDPGKIVELRIEGNDVELDKTIIEAINLPLEHIVRNCVEHGIETPEQRIKSAKPRNGKIEIAAFHDAGQVNIKISDDGKGIDADKVAKIAISKGLVSEKEVSLMTWKKKTELIFHTDFSMSSQENTSRENGLQMVLKNIEAIGGVIDINSTLTKGTEVLIKLPLTLAIIPSQIVSVENQKYAIPQVNLDELIRIPPDQVKHKINMVGNAPVLKLRGDLLPVVDLASLLNIEKTYIDPLTNEKLPDRRGNIADRRSRQLVPPENKPLKKDRKERTKYDRRASTQSTLNIAVVSAGTFKFCLIVKGLNDSEEIVVKPLGRLLKDCIAFAGATIMGDGKAALILDISNLAQMAGLSSVTRLTENVEKTEKELLSENRETDSILFFHNSESEYFAIPLEAVERIERVKESSIECTGGKRIIQYRGGALPLYELSEIFSTATLPPGDIYEVIVLKLNEAEAGIIASPPIDSLEVSVHIDTNTLKQPGLKGSAIIQEKTTLIIDPDEIAEILQKDMV